MENIIPKVTHTVSSRHSILSFYAVQPVLSKRLKDDKIVIA